MIVCCECCVLSGRGLCDRLTTRPEESYRLWVRRCVWYRKEPNINHLWLNLKNRRYITGCISCMSLMVTVKHNCCYVLGHISMYWRGGFTESLDGTWLENMRDLPVLTSYSNPLPTGCGVLYSWKSERLARQRLYRKLEVWETTTTLTHHQSLV
jgi:hypothetical protein